MDLNHIDDELKENFSDYLKRHREASGKTLDGISRTTRIPKRYLQALEDGDASKLPEEAFARGFLRSYSQEVGLDTDETLLRYERFRRSLMPTQIREVKKPSKYMLLGDMGDAKPLPQWLLYAVAGGVVVIVLVVGTLWFIRHKSETESVSSVSTQEEVAKPVETVTETATLVDKPAEAPGPSAHPTAAPAAPTASKPPPAMVTPVTPSTLTITAKKEGKISIRLDENPIQEISMRSGDTQVLNVFREVEIRSADKTTFGFQYNGKPLEVSGPVIKLFNRNLFTKKP
ncbi:MAG: helix-turn-helix domain-containing protein [Deltaproteobacteria bacterium]|nr:helix-turn-helix domain-containing protein [Deltaproteobacteria bacterium]